MAHEQTYCQRMPLLTTCSKDVPLFGILWKPCSGIHQHEGMVSEPSHSRLLLMRVVSTRALLPQRKSARGPNPKATQDEREKGASQRLRHSVRCGCPDSTDQSVLGGLVKRAGGEFRWLATRTLVLAETEGRIPRESNTPLRRGFCRQRCKKTVFVLNETKTGGHRR